MSQISQEKICVGVFFNKVSGPEAAYWQLF